MTSSTRSLNVPGAGHNAPIPLGARVGPLICSSGISGKDPATGQLPPTQALPEQAITGCGGACQTAERSDAAAA